MKTIIIGGGAAAMTTASKLRRNNQNAKIIVYQLANYVSLGACGIPYFISDEFSDVQNLIARTPEHFAKQNISVFTRHQLIDVDFKKKIVTVRNHNTDEVFTDTYDNLVIATGASPLVPNFENNNLKNIYTVVNIEDAINIKKRSKNAQKIAIIGGGFIGLEILESFVRLKKEVILVEALERIMERTFDEEITGIVMNYLSKKPVKIYLQQKLLGFRGNKKVESIVLDNGETIATDLVILALGFVPNTNVFQNKELNMLPNGAIIVDSQGKTNVDNVYSVGDCATINNIVTNRAEYIPLATTAIKLARVIANVINQQDDLFLGTLGSSILQILDLQLAKTGISEYLAKTLKLNYETIVINDYDLPSYMPKRMPLTLKLLYNANNQQIIGAQMVGYNKSVLRINALATAIWNKMTVQDLEQLDLVYAPPFSRTSDIIHISASKMTRSKEGK